MKLFLSRTRVIGYGIESIDVGAFYGCPADFVYITAQTPPSTGAYAFTSYIGQLFVQGENTKNAYESATIWKDFSLCKTMIEPDEIVFDGETKIFGKPGDKFDLRASLKPSNVTLPYILWYSTNSDIATVDQNGLVTIIAESDGAQSSESDDESSTRSCKIIAETLYSHGPIVEIEVSDNNAGINESVMANPNRFDIDFSAEFDIYNIEGVRMTPEVKQLPKGIYILRQGVKSRKILVK